MSLKCHRDAVELFYNRCTIVDTFLLNNHSKNLEIASKPLFFSLENASKQPKMHFFCIFFGETLASFKKSSYFCIAIGSWCNGNTTGFGSVILGSNPGDPTKCADWLRPRRRPSAHFFIYAFRNTEGARRAMTPPLLSALCFLPLHHTYGFSEISG